MRDAAIAARRDMAIHRQACGFRVGNHRAMEDFYPIPARLTPRGRPATAEHDAAAAKRDAAAAQRRWEQAMSRPAVHFRGRRK